MKDKVFLDTNILVYLYTNTEPFKKFKSGSVILENRCFVSTQSLNEFSNVCIRKLGFDKKLVLQAIEEICTVCNLIAIDIGTIKKSLALSDKYGYAYYDCLMLASAVDEGCSKFITEDMQNGQVIEDCLVIENIFARR